VQPRWEISVLLAGLCQSFPSLVYKPQPLEREQQQDQSRMMIASGAGDWMGDMSATSLADINIE
jgi:hypothetical protein